MEEAGGQRDGPVGMEAAGGQRWPWVGAECAQHDGTSRSARGQERWSSQGLRETVCVCALGVLPLLPQHGSGRRVRRGVGVGVAHGMDGVQGGAGCEAGVSHPRHQVS